MTFSNHDYYSRTINSIKSQPNINDIVLYGVLISLIPIIGFIWVSGFILKWAIDLSCGRSVVLTKQDFNFNSCMHKGLIFVAVGIIYKIAFGVVLSVLSPLSGVILLGSVYSLLEVVGKILVPIFSVFGGFYAVVLDDFSAGFKVDKFYEMIKRDVSGFITVGLIALVVSVVLGAIASLLIAIVTAVSGVSLAMSLAAAVMQASLLSSLFSLFVVSPIYILLTSAVASISYFLGSLFVDLAYALWVSQYQVAKWHNKEQDIPSQLNEGDLV